MPYQLIMAAAFIFGLVPSLHRVLLSVGHWRSKMDCAGSIPEISERCPPADVPVSTIFEASRLYSLAWYATHLSAQRQSSTAAGAGELRARRYSTLMTAHPRDKYGSSWNTLRSFCPSTQPPP